ncbi:MAG: hypothetical protein IRY92_13975 [Dactylosporangium sp.]|nr:hypothetical protein [Dactylosporangium sp.]
MGWKVMRFPVDELEKEPEPWRRQVQQLIGRLLGHDEESAVGLKEQAILRMAMAVARPFTVREAAAAIGAGPATARRVLRSMVLAGLLEPASGRLRVRTYRVAARTLI